MRLFAMMLILVLNAAPAHAFCQRDILMFDAHWCNFCRATKAFFHRHGVPYRTIDIMSNVPHWSAVLSHNFGDPGIPVVIFDGHWNGVQLTAGTVIRGYDEYQLRQALCLPL